MKSIKEFINKNINESRLLSDNTSNYDLDKLYDLLKILKNKEFKITGNIEKFDIDILNIFKFIKDPKLVGLFVEWLVYYYILKHRYDVELLKINNLENNKYPYCDFRIDNQDFEVKATSREIKEIDFNNRKCIKFIKGITLSQNQLKYLENTIIIIVRYEKLTNENIIIKDIYIKNPNEVLVNMTTIDGILK